MRKRQPLSLCFPQYNLHDVFPEKNMIKIVHYLFFGENVRLKKKSSSLQGLSQSFISQDCSSFEYLYLITFLVFKLFLVSMGTLGGKPLQYMEGRGPLCFHGLIFLLIIVLSTKSKRLTNPSEVLALKVFRLDANKTNMKLDKIFII